MKCVVFKLGVSIMWRIFAFLSYGVLLSSLAFGIVPWIFGKAAPELSREVHARDIDASALFYSESDEVDEAFNYFQNSHF